MDDAPETTASKSEAAPPTTRRSTRRYLIDALKAVATLVILLLVLRKVPFSELGARLGRLSTSDVALLAALTVTQVTLGVVRWYRLLWRLGERVPFFGLYGDVLVGLTYNMFLPTTVGGDVIRAMRCRARVSAAHRAWSTSLYERIAGLLAMTASGAIAATLGASTLIPTSIRLVATALTLALLLVFFGAAAPFRLLVRFFEKRLAPQTEMRAIVQDLEGPLATSGARLEALFWSLLYQAIGVLFVVVGARGLGAPGHALAIVIGVPLIHVLSMIPVTIGGLGLREGLFVEILGRLGMASDVALGLAAQWLASSVAFAIVGALIALLARPRPIRPERG